MKELIHSGSVKNVYKINDDVYEFEFTDRISVFDKPIPNEIPGKGQSLCDTACYWFKLLDNLNIDHHFIERSGFNTITVKSVKIIRDYSKIIDCKTNHLIPLECIVRHYIAGMLFDRLKRNEISLEELGLDQNQKIEYGLKLPLPFFEVGTKLEEYDKFLSIEDALKMAKISHSRLEEIKHICLSIDSMVEEQLNQTNLIHVDGKKEFGYDKNGNLMIVDVFGTADEDRYWDKKKYEIKKECIELSKEAVRQYYRKIGYKDELYSAREKGLPEPPIPELPRELINEISEMYKSIADQICNKS